MRLPEPMQHMSFPEWNYTVKGLVEVWELARLLGLERSLEARLEKDDGTLARELGVIGHDLAKAETMLRRSALALTLSNSRFLEDAHAVIVRHAARAEPLAIPA
jgi:hypothetical protein